jgi:hypothetical protein
VHELDAGHEAPVNPSVAGVGVVWIDQLDPFQRSASGARAKLSPAAVEKPPAAVQEVVALHDTPVNVANVVPAGLGGVGLIIQLVPFQCWANSVSAWNVFGLVENPPTVMHEVVDAHDTALKTLNVSPEAFGVGWTDQLVPFHISTSLAEWLVAVTNDLPTATQKVADGHDTPCRVAPLEPEGTGTLWTAQLVPVHRSASGC